MSEIWRRRQLGLEFALLFVAAPVVMAVALPPTAIFAGLFAMTSVGLVLLIFTPEFHWSELLAGARQISRGFVTLFAALTAAASFAVVWMTHPDALFGILRSNPGLMVMIAILYPLVSALPQELVYRPLFFRRYATILPRGLWPNILLNAVLFSFAHLMYWSWIVAAMTFFGGIGFAYAYRARRNFPEALLLHALSGVIVFAFGLGVYFYSGNVTRPF